MTTTLLQSKVSDGSMSQVVVWSAVIVVVLTLGLAVVSRVKKRLQGDEQTEVSAGFTLSDLRRMRDAGEVSAEEYDKARARVIDAAKRAAEREAPVKPAPKPVIDMGDEDQDEQT